MTSPSLPNWGSYDPRRRTSAQAAMQLALSRELVDAAAASIAQPVSRSPWLDMPAGGQPFRYPNAAATTLPAQAAESTVVSFTVPLGRNGVIQRLANQFIGGGFTEGSGGITWRIEVNGVPVSGFHNLLGTNGTMSAPADLTASPIRIHEGDFVALICRNVSVNQAQQPLLGMLGGYFYPLSQEIEDPWL